MLVKLIKKEIREMLSRSVIISIAIMALMFGVIGKMFSRAEENIDSKAIIGVVNKDGGKFSVKALNIIKRDADVIYCGNDIKAGLKNVRDREGIALVTIGKNFTDDICAGRPGKIEIHWVMRGAGLIHTISAAPVHKLVQSVNREISMGLMDNAGMLSSAHILNPIESTHITDLKGKEFPGLFPDTLVGVLQSQSVAIPVVIMMLISMVGSSLIASLGMEKENKTLETLLTLPVKRSYIIIGKIVGSAAAGLIMALIYMIGFGYYIRSFTMTSISPAELGLTLNALDYLLVGLSLFSALLAGLVLCMILGAFARDHKSARSLSFPISLLTLIPMFIIMFQDFETLSPVAKTVIFAIPFSHPMMAMRLLMFDEYFLVISGIVYSTALTALMIAIMVWLFKTDILLTGRIRNKARI